MLVNNILENKKNLAERLSLLRHKAIMSSGFFLSMNTFHVVLIALCIHEFLAFLTRSAVGGCFERKDLMPEGERQVRFHAHTMSTMDALPEVEEIVATAAKWGLKR